MTATQQRSRVLVVDDERSVLTTLEVVLKRSGYDVTGCDEEAQALEAFRSEQPDIVLQDLRMGGAGGLELLKRFKAIAPQIPVIVITAYSTWDNAVSAMRLGAYDFIRKPYDNDAIREVIARALAQRKQWEASKEKADASAAQMILGNSPALRELLDILKRVAPTDSTILVTGESGTGKELLARAVHYLSLRAGGPFVTVNCGAFPEALLESELFGHVKGAFSGAIVDKKGLIEVADGGTFFLDEVGEMPPETQVKLLRVLEERRFFPVGGTSPHRVDVRFVAATNKDLGGEVAAGRLREDLYYRLNVIPLHIPPLRERKSDIPLLAAHFVAKYAGRVGKEIKSISPGVQAKLEAHDWPGNVRELENSIQRAVALARGEVIDEIDLTGRALRPQSGASSVLSSTRLNLPRIEEPKAPSVTIPDEGFDLEAHLASIERAHLIAALEQTGWHLTNAAKLLGITFRAIRYKIKKHGLKDARAGSGVDAIEDDAAEAAE